MVLAQATWATMIGIPFVVRLHVNATCTGPDDRMCDSYEDLSPGVENGDGWGHYFQPMGGARAESRLNLSEANIVELGEFDVSNLAYGYIIRGDDDGAKAGGVHAVQA